MQVKILDIKGKDTKKTAKLSDDIFNIGEIAFD